jgi:hypothetical protein
MDCFAVAKAGAVRLSLPMLDTGQHYDRDAEQNFISRQLFLCVIAGNTIDYWKPALPAPILDTSTMKVKEKHHDHRYDDPLR